MLFTRINWRFLFAGALVVWCIQGLFAQNNQEIYFKYCTVHPRAECFNPIDGAVDSVGRDVIELGGGYRFCLAIDSVDAGYAPLRVILVLDNSGSMCFGPGAMGCCEEGDGTDSCMYNDPGNKRVEAAKTFVDSLRAKSVNSEIGVVVYAQTASALAPLQLNSDANVNDIKDYIDRAACTQRGIGKKTYAAATYLGLGLQEALRVVDANFSSIPSNMTRHIILLTDGAWDDADTRSPAVLFDTYTTQHSDRIFPTVHGVFISDSALHVRHGFAPQGCADDEVVDLAQLGAATQVGPNKGMFFGGSTPETIVNTFLALLKEIVQPEPRTLEGMTVTNLSNGEVREHTSIVNAGTVDSLIHFDATINNLPLVTGANLLQVVQVIQRPGTEVLETVIDTVTIYKTDDWTSTFNQGEYDEYCVEDTTTVSISVTPPLLLVNNPFLVKSTVQMKNNFNLNNIEVRVFTRFPDTDASSVAVFHFENNLVNSANTANEGTGTVNYTTTEALFDAYSLSQGTFSTSIGNLANDFTLEAWVRPASAGGATDIFSGSGNTFSIDNDGFISFSAGGSPIVKSTIAVDPNTWTHIGAVKTNNTITLFINGVNCTESTAFTGSFAGAMTIACPSGGMLDEVRISNASRLRADAAPFLRLNIPSVQNISWTLGAQPALVQPYLLLTPDMWTNGDIQFQFASPVAGRVVVNFQHQGTALSEWGKNGNPVTVASDLQGPYITKAVYTNGPMNQIYDTLVVFFSEPVRCDSLKKSADPGSSFRVYHDNMLKQVFAGSKYSERDPCPAGNLITQATIIVQASVDGILPGQDSILLVGTAVDTAGNYPDTTRKGPIVWGPGAGIQIQVLQGDPVDPMQISAGIAARTGTTERVGKVVVVETRGPLMEWPALPNGKKTYGKTVIFDVVGNVVAVDVPLLPFVNRDRKYFMVWNGLNRYGRKVGAGAYLLRATVIYESEPEKYVPLETKIRLKWGRSY
ncbi:MAG: VWA domain-containing protein [Chitinispirillaceae bacterium]|nr:VWA domain-containing protein [Chitinispirillaceae bacterium]